MKRDCGDPRVPVSVRLRARCCPLFCVCSQPPWAQDALPFIPPGHPAGRRLTSHAGHPCREVIPGKAIRTDVDLALVNVTVTDPYNRLVTGLDKENFRVFEDNVEQEVVTLSSEDVPISIGVIFDMSGSMSDKVDKAREAAVQFFKTANPAGPVLSW